MFETIMSRLMLAPASFANGANGKGVKIVENKDKKQPTKRVLEGQES